MKILSVLILSLAFFCSSCNKNPPLSSPNNLVRCELTQKIEFSNGQLSKQAFYDYDEFLNVVKSFIVEGGDSLITTFTNRYSGSNIVQSTGFLNGELHSSKTFEYFDSGELKFTEYLLNDSPLFIETYEYYKNGKMKNYFKRYSETGTVEIANTYDNNNLVEFHSKLNGETAEHSIYAYRPDGQILFHYLLGSYRTDTVSYTYNSSNQLIKSTSNESFQVFEYGESGLLKSKKVYSKDGNSGQEFSYEYDNKGKLIRELERPNERYPFLLYREYSYYGTGEKREEKAYDTWTNGGNEILWLSEYDTFGNLIKNTNYLGNGKVYFESESSYLCK